MTAVPAVTPVTTPPTTVAMPVLPLVQVPPAVASANVVVEPTHTVAVPVIGATPGTSSVMVTFLLFQWSPDVEPFSLTAFTTP